LQNEGPVTGRWRIELFGGLRAREGDRVVTHFETRKISALLACLALHAPRSQAREVLAEKLWPEEDWGATRNRLRHALSSLRKELEPQGAPDGGVLVASRTDVCLNPAAITTDVAEFSAALVRGAQAADAAEQIRCLRLATDLYTGDFLPGFYEDWVVAERERFSRAYLGALVALAGMLAASGDSLGAIEVVRRAVAADPVREDARCDLMRYLVAAGRASEAVREYRALERVLAEELGATPSPASRAVLAGTRAAAVDVTAEPPATSSPGVRSTIAPDLEAEGGAVPLGSRFYVTRATDQEFHTAIRRGDSIVLVKGPRQVGKTSLLARGLQEARANGARVVRTDLQKLGTEHVESAAALFRAFGEMLADQLDLDVSLDESWNPQRGWNVNFERFLRRQVLAASEAPLVWALDEVDRLFTCPFSSVVFGLFRSWHNERSLNPDGPWRRLTLAIAYATEAHLFITDLNQSPFNVGTRLTLEDFANGEVAELNHRYGAPLRDADEVARYAQLVGGHPYLVRRGLHALAESTLDLGSLEAQAARDEGIFSDHLVRMLSALRQDRELCDAVAEVLSGAPCPAATSFYRLRSAGVLVGHSPADARPRCRLYADFLRRHLRY